MVNNSIWHTDTEDYYICIHYNAVSTVFHYLLAYLSAEICTMKHGIIMFHIQVHSTITYSHKEFHFDLCYVC